MNNLSLPLLTTIGSYFISWIAISTARFKIHQTVLKAKRIFGDSLDKRKPRLKMIKSMHYEIRTADLLIRFHLWIHRNFSLMTRYAFLTLFMYQGMLAIFLKTVRSGTAFPFFYFAAISMTLSFVAASLNMAIERLRLVLEQMEAAVSERKTK